MFGNDLKEYDIRADLSSCCNNIGVVYLAQHVPSKELVALKKYRMDKAKEENIYIRDEILMMRQFNHTNLLPFYTAFVNDFDLHVIAPIMCYGSCKDVINHAFSTGFPEIMVALILRDVLNGLDYLHKKGYIHRSIRASHILLNEKKAVLCGFRECTSLISNGERTKTLYNLPPNNIKGLTWLAPEVLEQNLLGYTEKSDVYSLGITTCEMANGIEPFVDMPTTFMFTEKVRGNQPTLLDNSTCPPEDMLTQNDLEVNDFAQQTRKIYSGRKLSDSFHKFAEKCLQRFADNRPSVLQLLNHSFFKQIKHTSLQEQFVLCHNIMDMLDITKIREEEIKLVCEFGDMDIGGNFEWDF